MSVDFKEFSRRMDKTMEHLGEEFDSVRAGRANPKVLDRITVEYYGSETPLNGVATISSPDARTLVIQPWDGKLLKDIQKAIQVSDLGINPQNDGRVIRLVFPQLTEERRKDLIKQVKKYAEEAKVALRNIAGRHGLCEEAEKEFRDHRGRPEKGREGSAGSAGSVHQKGGQCAGSEGKGIDGYLTGRKRGRKAPPNPCDVQ